MAFKLKKNAPEIQPTEGPLAGMHFVHGKVYDEIPAGDARLFEEVPEKNAPDKSADKAKKGDKL